jgi:hypothetical protein
MSGGYMNRRAKTRGNCNLRLTIYDLGLKRKFKAPAQIVIRKLHILKWNCLLKKKPTA